MKRRTTIELDEALLARARRALGGASTRATVEEAVRRLVEPAFAVGVPVGVAVPSGVAVASTVEVGPAVRVGVGVRSAVP